MCVLNLYYSTALFTCVVDYRRERKYVSLTLTFLKECLFVCSISCATGHGVIRPVDKRLIFTVA